MPKLIIADTSCIIVLEKIGHLEILRHLFETITITPEVSEEFGTALPKWVDTVPVKDAQRQRLLELELDKGEASAIALALESDPHLLLIDERKGRRIANQLNLTLTGTLGILIQAKQQRLIPSLKEEINKLKSIDFRMSHSLIQNILVKYETD